MQLYAMYEQKSIITLHKFYLTIARWYDCTHGFFLMIADFSLWDFRNNCIRINTRSMWRNYVIPITGRG